MTERTHDIFGDRLDAYLDDLLDERDRAAFEQFVRDHPDLRKTIAQQDAIDASIRRSCAPPSEEMLRAIAFRALEERAHDAAVHRIPATFRPWAAAAALLLCATGLWMIWSVASSGFDRHDPYEQPWRSMTVVYHDQQDVMKPDWICENDLQFRTAFERRLNQPLLLSALPEGVAALGLCYSNTISERTMYLLAAVDGTPVLVFVDRAEHDSGEWLEEAVDLHAHRAGVGDLVLYEVSPFDQPRLLAAFYNPDEESQP